MSELDNPFIVDFPLRGEWVAAHTPAQKIPSHGTDQLGQRYAYDFIRTDERAGMHLFRNSNLKYWLVGVPTRNSYCWQEAIYSPLDGEVIVAKDGLKERSRLHPVLDLLRVLKNMVAVTTKVLVTDLRKIDWHLYIGNHVIIRHNNVYAFLAHMHPNSISVKVGQIVYQGDFVGKVGHTGNSTAPHLHFHLMDSGDLLTAKGISCAFKEYEVFEEGQWELVRSGIPKYNQRIRYRT